MQKKLFFIITIGIALMLDILFSRALIHIRIIPPFTIMALSYWFWRFDLVKRIILAFIVGLFFDVFGFLPMGAHTLIFLCTAYVCEPMKSFFSNNEARIVIGLNVFLLLIFTRLLVMPVSFVMTLL